MIVPYLERPSHPEYEFNAAQTALWNLCLVLKPRYILDIGTMGGTSALLAATYLEQYQDGQGHVVTLDVVPPIKPLSHPLITALQVWPYTTHGLLQYPWDEEVSLRPDWEAHIPTSQDENAAMAWKALLDKGGERFDLAYVDGDHSELGIWFDLQMIKRLVCPPHYALLDDVYMPDVPAGRVYKGRLQYQYNHYDFDGDGWENFVETRPNVWGMPRMALIWER